MVSGVSLADDYDRVGLTIAYVYYHPEGKAGQSNGRIYRNLDRGPYENCAHIYDVHEVYAHLKINVCQIILPHLMVFLPTSWVHFLRTSCCSIYVQLIHIYTIVTIAIKQYNTVRAFS